MKKFTKINENIGRKMKIGIDLHGVITDMPHFFSFFTNAMIKAGAEVHIITGGATDDDLKLLKDFNIRYTHYFSILDHHKERKTPTSGKHPRYGFDMISDEAWDKTKADYCRENDISLHIDDTLNYNDTFTTPFAMLWTHKNQGKIERNPRHNR